MGLMNIGKSEGPQIIQLFGRGVRLLGKDRSLMRSSAMTNISKPENIELLETLQIFGLQANYMEQFRKYLKEEGIDTEERVQINLKVQFPNSLDRKSTRLNSSHVAISYAVFCLKKKKKRNTT